MHGNDRCPRGMTLIEVLVGMTIVAALAAALLPLLDGGRRVGVTAGEVQAIYAALGGMMDRLVGEGYDALRAEAGRPQPLDLGTGHRGLDGQVGIDELKPGLLRLVVTVWRRSEAGGSATPTRFLSVRLLAAPGDLPPAAPVGAGAR